MGGTPVDSGQDIANDALYMSMAAAVVIPAAWPLVSMMFVDNCSPGGIYAAGEAWLQVAQELANARAAADAIQSDVAGTGWQGEDQKGYDDKAKTYGLELLGDEILATIVGVALVTMAVLLFARILFMMALAVILDIFLGLIIAAAASIIGDLGATEALMASANEFALEAIGWLKTFDEVVLGVELGFTAGIGAGIGGNVVGALALGDTSELGNLGQATVDGLGTITAGLVSRIFRDTVAKGIKLPLGNAGEALPGLTQAGSALGKSVGLSDTIAGGTPIDPLTKWLASLG